MILNYISWDGARWTAKLESGRFLHAPEGDWKRAHGDTILIYISWDGAKWTARIENGRFLHAPSGDFGKAHPVSILNYVTWDKNALDRPPRVKAPGADRIGAPMHEEMAEPITFAFDGKTRVRTATLRSLDVACEVVP